MSFAVNNFFDIDEIRIDNNDEPSVEKNESGQKTLRKLMKILSVAERQS